MAEPLSVIASGIAIAQVVTTIGVAVVRLKEVLAEVRDVPGHISDLIEQIDFLDPAFWELEQNKKMDIAPGIWDTPAAERSATYCRKALAELNDMADDLTRQIHSPKRWHRKIAGLKVALNCGMIKKLERRLETTLRMVMCAQQGYTIMLLKQQPDVIAERIAQRLEHGGTNSAVDDIGHLADIDDPKTPKHKANADARGMVTKHQRTTSTTRLITNPALGQLAIHSTSQTIAIEFRPALWLTNCLYAFSSQIDRGYAGWNFHFRAYSIRSWNDPVFAAATSGDVPKLQALFSAGRGSPFDVAEHGNSMLHAAVWGTASATVQLFAQMGYGLDLSCENETGFDVLDWVLATDDISDIGQYLEFVNTLLDYDAIPETDQDIAASKCQCPDTFNWSVFRLLQPRLCPCHPDTPLETRLERASTLHHGPVERVLFVLGSDWSIDPDAVCNFEQDGCSLIHTVAENCGCMGISDTELSSRLNGDAIERWQRFGREVVQRSKDIHLLELDCWRDKVATPLLHVVWTYELYSFWFGFPISTPISTIERGARTSLHRWLEILQAAGVDLVAYASRENEILRDDSLDIIRSQSYPRDGLGLNKNARYEHRIIGFKYGAESYEWDVWWNEPTDEFAGDFWKLIEDPPLHVPGAWFNQDDNDDI